VFNYFRGRCYAATDPLLGTGGDGGNVWTLIGTELVQQKQFEESQPLGDHLLGEKIDAGRVAARPGEVGRRLRTCDNNRLRSVYLALPIQRARPKMLTPDMKRIEYPGLRIRTKLVDC